MSTKPKYPRAVALDVCRDLVKQLGPVCERLIIAGSLRRRKEEVGDVEILFIPKTGTVYTTSLFGEQGSLADAHIEDMITTGRLIKRPNKNGGFTYGAKNKLMIHAASGVPVDLFTATEVNWWNYLVCRTGPAESNARIASLAIAKGFRWSPYGAGFTEGRRIIPMNSEREVFAFVGLDYLEPWERF